MDWMDVKAGDLVARYDYRTMKGVVWGVERITKTQIVVSGGLRLRRRNGGVVGGYAWSVHCWTCDAATIEQVVLANRKESKHRKMAELIFDATSACGSKAALDRLVKRIEAACAEAREGV